MKTIWMTSLIHKALIQAVRCVKSTEKTVWVEEVKFKILGKDEMAVVSHSRKGQYEQYHDTWDLAHSYLVSVAVDKLDLMRFRYDAALAYSEEVNNLRKPDGA